MKKQLRVALFALLSLALVATAQAAEKYKGYPRGEAFITAQELNQMIKARDPKLVVIAMASKPQYLSGHIPGSHQIWRPDYEAPAETQNGVAGNLIDAAGFTKLMQGIGVNADSKIVIYDHKFDATRMWWALYYYGKTDARILDGGIKAWTKAGYDTDMVAGGKTVKAGTWVAKVTYPTMRATTAEVATLKDNRNAQLWDVRADKEVSGEEMLSGAARAGRIPWSVQADWVHVKTKENDAEWVTAAEARKFVEKLGFDMNKQQYAHCQTAVRSTQILFTLYALGWAPEKLSNYDDAWLGWSRDEKLPIEKGAPDTTPAPWQKR